MSTSISQVGTEASEKVQHSKAQTPTIRRIRRTSQAETMHSSGNAETTV